MRFLSVCSGIEAASVAWAPLGWKAAAFSEIEPFPSAVLARHYPDVPNWGDLTKWEGWPNEKIDLLCGGTPCQSFSVAGKREGMADARGQLLYSFLGVASRYRPRWIVWENVPGVLSSGGGRDFGAFLGALGKLGYGWAYRVLDAQNFGVPQRRRRMFVVGHLGDWRRAAAVLFEPESVRGYSPSGREAGEKVIGTFGARSSGGGGFGTDFDCDGGIVTHTLRAEGFDASEDGTGRGTPIIPVGVAGGDIAFSLRANPSRSGDKGDGGMNTTMVETFDPVNVTSKENRSRVEFNAPGNTLHGRGMSIIGPAVRRLTPRECERLQGFPDDYTLVPYRGKPAADGPRYRALGNSWAVPVARWVGERIQGVEKVK